MKLAIGSDHAGYELKETVKEYLGEQGVDFKDFGTYSADSCDYPDFGQIVAEAVASGEYPLGILICGTGIGMSMVANKVPGVRAALCGDTFSAHSSREHNHANLLVLGARVVGAGLALDIVKTWLTASPLGDRHARRVEKIAAVERKYGRE
ncbi:MAG: ribose 5-phosphate isomerase B [Firmicutes bacterium]|nr:ribose 5-phosphate isomerase B [Bacillota bacterium]